MNDDKPQGEQRLRLVGGNRDLPTLEELEQLRLIEQIDLEQRIRELIDYFNQRKA